jgi:hypothetical protein
VSLGIEPEEIASITKISDQHLRRWRATSRRAARARTRGFLK